MHAPSFFSAPAKQTALFSSLDAAPPLHPLSSSSSSSAPFFAPSAALPIGDAAALKARLTGIVDDLQRSGVRDAIRSFVDLVAFFEALSEQSGAAVQHLFGQHVMSNVLFVVMDAVVKPALAQYCGTVAQQRQNRANAPGGKSLRKSAARAPLSVAAIAEAELDAQSDAKTKRLRSDVARPFRSLVEILHMHLPASLLSRATAGSTAPSQNNNSGDSSHRRGHAEDGAADFNAPPPPPSLQSASAAEPPQRWWASAPNYTSLPLLWKNAVPLHMLTKHALEVMQSNILPSVCGAEYAQLLLRVLAYDGYLAALQPVFICELTRRLLQLIENTSYESVTNNETMASVLPFGQNYEEPGHDAFAGNEGLKSQTTVDDGTTYAALLVQLLRAPHIMSSFSPCEDTAITTTPMQGELTIPLLLHSLVRLTTRRHARFTNALRLEAHLLVALNQLVSAARHDYPLACAAPLELVKLLCHFFYATARRDGWRMEALSFMTTQLCATFSAVLGQCVRVDIEATQRTPKETCEELLACRNASNKKGRYKRKNDDSKNDEKERQEQLHQQQKGSEEHEQEHQKDVSADAKKKTLKGEMRHKHSVGYAEDMGSALATTTASVPPHCLTLLHETVLPFALRLFAVARSEFSHVSRRELFHFPCPKLAPLFDFGAVVVYLACRTHENYVTLPAASSLSFDAHARKRHRTDNLEAQEKNEELNEESVGCAHRGQQPHPSTEIARLFRSFFFLEGSPQYSGSLTKRRKLTESDKNSSKNGPDVDDSRTHIVINSSASSSSGCESPEKRGGVSRGAAAAAAGSTLSAAAVQDLVGDGALFLLHLLAQPSVALGIGPRSSAQLVEDNLLPLFPHYGVRLEGLLLAALQALTPRAGLRCERNVFCWLLRRYIPSPTTQRDDESQPKESVYRLLASLLERTTGRAPMRLTAEEKDRLTGAVHFATIATRVRAAHAVSSANHIPSPTTVLARAPVTAAGGGEKGITSLASRAAMSSSLFQSMLHFLAALHLSLCSGCIVVQGIPVSILPSFSPPASPSSSSTPPLSLGTYSMSDHSAVHISTGLSFVFSCISHTIFFFPPEEGVTQLRDTASDAAARYFLLQTMGYIESFLVALTAFFATNGDSGSSTQIHAPGRYSGKIASSLRRMLRFILRARQSASASSLSPAAHMPSAVCSAAEGHWLLLPPFIPSAADMQGLQSIAASLVSSFSACDGTDDGNDVCATEDQLRRGDVPPIVVETVASAVSSVVVDFSLRAQVVRTAQDERRDTTDDFDVSMALCVQAVQLMHTVLRLFRIGLWHLPLAGTNDLAALESAVSLFDDPSTVFTTLSPEGKLYYAVMWCAAHISLRMPRLLHRDRPLLRVLYALFDDVGHVLLAQPFALWEPRQIVIGLAGAICRRSLEGITGFATRGTGHSTAHTTNSEEYVLRAQDTIRYSCLLMGIILAQARRSRVIHASVDPLVEPSLVCQRVTELLAADGLITSHGEAVTRINPFLPASLPVIDSLAGLLQVLHEECGDSAARRGVQGLLTTLFARYRYSMTEGIFLAFGFYAPQRSTSASAMLRDMDAVSENGVAREDEEQNEENEERIVHLNQSKQQGPSRADVQQRQNLTTRYADGCSLLLEEGRLLASFVDQLTDAARKDIPVMTVQSQCAVLSSIYGLLFRCESTIAEKLGKYLFSFLSVSTAYAVRRHTALHVRYLFTRFTHQAFAVLHELLYRGREGIASLSPMLCATSLRALGEAARAAPVMEPDVIGTLLECWATRGFAHRGLLTECLELIGNTMSAKELCHYYCERLLFDWLWRLRHPMEAFPVVCFGYSCVSDMTREVLSTVLPLAVLCSARRSGAGSERLMPNTGVPTAGFDDNEGYFCPSGLLWRLVGSRGSEDPERSPTQLVDCLVLNFSDVVARLLAFATLSRGTRRANENFCGNVDTQEVAEAAKVSLEWMRSTFTAHRERTGSDFSSLLRIHGDGILCRLVNLVGTAAPMPAVSQLYDSVKLYCSLAGTPLDEFFSSDAGDHAYVLLQHIYACAMGGVARGPRRALLILLFDRVVRQWWSSRVLHVPHVAHTVLRVSGNLLMSCPAERPVVCDVLLYTWTILTSSGNATSLSSLSSVTPSFRQLLLIDEAFLSTVMLSLAEESRAVASTWSAICRTDTSLKRRDWQLQHSQYTAAGNEVVIVDEDNENDEEDGGEKEGNQTIQRLLPLLRNVVLVSGAPASAYYADLASAVDAARDAFARAIRTQQIQSREKQTSSSICNALSRALRHLFAVVISSEDGGSSVSAILEQSLTLVDSVRGSAGAPSLSSSVLSCPRDALLPAFDLLRAIAWCFIEAGAEQQVDALLSPTGAMERQMQEDSLDTVLHDAYCRHLEQLYRLAFDSDSRLAGAAAVTLRGWLCGTVDNTGDANIGMNEEKSTRRRHGNGEDVTLMQRIVTNMEQSEEKKKQRQGHNQQEQKQKERENMDDDDDGNDDDDGDDDDDDGGVMSPMLRLEDVLPFRRRSFGLPSPYAPAILDESDVIAASIASLQDENVWDALRVYADESRFLRFFLISLCRHYGLQHRVSTVAAVLSCLLLPTASGEYSRRRTSFFESFLPIALLHVMLLRETETHRRQRAQWSCDLQETLFAHAVHFPHTARLFLRALNVCRAAVMANVRCRGLRPDRSNPHILARMAIKSEDPSPFTFPLLPRSAYGELMEPSDMRESYWLSDMDPLVLASAAVACHEPHLAILFADLSGESLLGRRKGIPTSQFQNFYQQQNQPQQGFSVLFPSAQQPNAGGLQRTGLQRVEKAQAEVAARLFAFRTAVHAVRVDADAARRMRVGGTVEQDETNLNTAVAGGVDDVSDYATPWEEAFLMRYPLRRIEREKNRGNWHVVLALLDGIERSSVSCHAQHSQRLNSVITGESINHSRGTGDAHDPFHNEDYSPSIVRENKSNNLISKHAAVAGVDLNFSPAQIAIERANALMHLGANDTAIHILAAALKSQAGSQHRLCSSFALPEVAPSTAPHCGSFSGDDVSLRGALAASLWRCGRWDDEDMLFQQDASASVAPVTVDEGLFFALKGVHRGEAQEARRWSFLAQRQLARRLNPTNWLHTVLQSEALHNIAELSDSGALAQPRWIRAKSSLSDVRVHYDKIELLDSFRLRLCVACQKPDWWLSQLERGAARALHNGRPLLLRQWLSTHEEMSRVTGKEQMALLTSAQGLPASAFLPLLHARAEFAAGNSYGAIAILQNVAPVRSSNVEDQQSLLSLPPDTPSMPVIVHQLIDWVKEAGIVPLSQLVRDYFFTACVTSDKSGACSLQLARLCHSLARDIATRLRTPECRALQESIEVSRRTRVELEKQCDEVGRSEQEKKVLIRRIRSIQLDTAREQNEWVRQLDSYALYRRSALNAYARFMQYSDPAGVEDDTLAVFSFVSLWLQQDEQLDESTMMTDAGGGGGKTARGDGVPQSAVAKVLRKAIENTPHYKFLPLFSQLAAQLGTSMDNDNLEDLVRRIAMENPLHTVWPLLALTKGHKFGPNAAEGAIHVVDEKKVAIACHIVKHMKSLTNTGVQGDVWRRNVVSEAEQLSTAYMELALHSVRDTTKPSHRIPHGFRLVENIRNMSIPPPTITIPLPLTVSNSNAFPRILKYEPEFKTPGGINVPKTLRCVLSDGNVVRQLLKSEDDLRQDSLIEQVFSLSNKLLAKEQSTRSLRLYTYNVIPLAPTVGVIEWVDGTVSLGHYLTGSSGKWPIGAHERYFPDEPTAHECRRKMREAGKHLKHDTLLSIYAEFTPALHFFFLEHFFTPQEWLERRDAYTRSVAVASMVGYIVGLGDRHGSNLLLHTRRAELVHIDLGFAFDQAKLLPVPELVPFRLTRSVVDGLGVQGAEGPLRRHCEGTLRVMRRRREPLLTVLEACAHDPLARWAVTTPATRTDAPQEHVGGSRQRGAGVRRGKTTYAEAERTLSRVAEKIQGYEAGELLSVPTHVQKLLQAAQNTELLAFMFEGWSPWL